MLVSAGLEIPPQRHPDTPDAPSSIGPARYGPRETLWHPGSTVARLDHPGLSGAREPNRRLGWVWLDIQLVLFIHHRRGNLKKTLLLAASRLGHHVTSDMSSSSRTDLQLGVSSGERVPSLPIGDDCYNEIIVLRKGRGKLLLATDLVGPLPVPIPSWISVHRVTTPVPPHCQSLSSGGPSERLELFWGGTCIIDGCMGLIRLDHKRFCGLRNPHRRGIPTARMPPARLDPLDTVPVRPSGTRDPPRFSR